MLHPTRHRAHTLSAFSLFALLLGPAVAQTTWYVDAGGTPPGAGTIDDPYTSIQYALARASTVTGDTLAVAPGTYHEALRFLGKSVTIFGDPVQRPRVSAAGTGLPVVMCVDGEPSTPPPTLQNLVLEDGTGGPVGPSTGGAGIYVIGSTIRVRGCLFESMLADIGGVVFAENATLDFADSHFAPFEGSGGPEAGGAIYATDSTVLLVRCSFEGLRSISLGAAIHLFGGTALLSEVAFLDTYTLNYSGAIYSNVADITLRDCRFERCGVGIGRGGALALDGGVGLVERCEFLDCEAAEGGAIGVTAATLEVRDSTFRRNRAFSPLPSVTGSGGAVFLVPSSLVSLQRCLFVGNRADGIQPTGAAGCGGAVFGAALLQHCTLTENSALDPNGGPGLHGATCFASSMVSSIAWGNVPDSVDPLANILYSDVEGGAAGLGNLDADPVFVAPPVDLRLAAGSPCIDAGDPDELLDPDGSRADQGALTYEWPALGASFCIANANSTGAPGVIGAYGSPHIPDDWVRLTATGLPYHRFGYFLMGPGHDFVPFFGGSNGILCLAMPLYRFNIPPKGEILNTGNTGTVAFRPHLTNLPGNVVFHAGETWSFQLWFRDVLGSVNTSNTTDGVDVTWQ